MSLGSSADLTRRLKGEAREAYANMKAIFVESIRLAQQSGQVRPDVAAEELVDLIYGLFNATVARWSLRDRGSDARTQMELLWSFLVRGLGVEGSKA
jgi:hypothetical protein